MLATKVMILIVILINNDANSNDNAGVKPIEVVPHGELGNSLVSESGTGSSSSHTSKQICV